MEAIPEPDSATGQLEGNQVTFEGLSFVLCKEEAAVPTSCVYTYINPNARILRDSLMHYSNSTSCHGAHPNSTSQKSIRSKNRL